MPAQLRDLPLFISEFGIDWLTQGIEGGFWHDRNEFAPLWMSDQMREAWRRVYATTPQLRGICFFLWGGNSPMWVDYDMARTTTSAQTFEHLFAEELPGKQPVDPPSGEGTLTTEQQRSNDAFNAAGVQFNREAALYKFAAAHGLGYPVTNEYDSLRAGVAYVSQGYRAAIVEVKKGDWGNVAAFDWLTGAPYVPSSLPDDELPVPLPIGSLAALEARVSALEARMTGAGALPYLFPQELADIGARGEEGQRVPGQPFFRLAGASVRRGVSAFMVVTVIGKNGRPLIGTKVLNMFPDGNGEIIQTDGSGTARFQFGASSAFSNPGSGPFTVFVVDDTAFKDSDSVPKRVVLKARLSDIVKSLGDFEGQHTEINIQYVEQP
jgi:hypothetical protein